MTLEEATQLKPGDWLMFGECKDEDSFTSYFQLVAPVVIRNSQQSLSVQIDMVARMYRPGKEPQISTYRFYLSDLHFCRLLDDLETALFLLGGG